MIHIAYNRDQQVKIRKRKETKKIINPAGSPPFIYDDGKEKRMSYLPSIDPVRVNIRMPPLYAYPSTVPVELMGNGLLFIYPQHA